jgi:hypothetical protein
VGWSPGGQLGIAGVVAGFASRAGIDTGSTEFLDRLRRRLDAGFLTGTPHWRSHYVVTEHADREITFVAADFMRAINVGINWVRVQIAEEHGLEYVVTYWRWAAYCVALCALLSSVVAVGVLLFQDLRTQIDRTGAAIGWGMVIFWGFVWAWLLIALHKPFSKQCLNRVLAEIDGQAA